MNDEIKKFIKTILIFLIGYAIGFWFGMDYESRTSERLIRLNADSAEHWHRQYTNEAARVDALTGISSPSVEEGRCGSSWVELGRCGSNNIETKKVTQ